MAWTFVGTSSSAASATTSLTLTLPAGIAQGDLLVGAIAYRGVSGVSVTLPVGWTLIEEQKSGDADFTSGIGAGCLFYIIRGAADPALGCTIPVADSALGRVVAYRGVGAVPLGAHVSSTMGAVASPSTGTGVTTTADGDLIVVAIAAGDNTTYTAHTAADAAVSTSSGANSAQVANPADGTWQERADVGSGTGNDVGLSIADVVRGAAGPTGTVSAMPSTTSRAAVLVASFHAAPVIWLGAATLQGVGIVTAPFTQKWVTNPATLQGVAALFVDPQPLLGIQSASATLDGAGFLCGSDDSSFSVDFSADFAVPQGVAASHTPAGDATLAGVGQIAVETRQIWKATAALAAVGSTTAEASHTPNASATASSVGFVVANANHTADAAADVTGDGHLVVDATILGVATLWAGEASLAGSGSVTAVASLRLIASAALAGAGSINAAGIARVVATASLAGVGTAAVDAEHTANGAALLAGNSTFSALLEAITAEALLAGEGSLHVDVDTFVVGAEAELLGEGSTNVFAGVEYRTNPGQFYAYAYLFVETDVIHTQPTFVPIVPWVDWADTAAPRSGSGVAIRRVANTNRAIPRVEEA